MRLGWVVSVAALSPISAHAAEPRPLEHTDGWFLAAEFAGSLGVAVGVSLAAGDTPERCRWCEPTGFDKSVRNALVRSNRKVPGTLSHVVSFGVAPVLAFGSVVWPALANDRASWAVQDSVIVLDGFILTTGIVDGVKKTAARRRPAFYYGEERRSEMHDNPSEENLSFFSGDTAWVFTLGASSSTLCFLHGYDSAPWVAAGGAVLGVSAGMLRIAADAHWATDVGAAAVAGTAVGAGLPLLLHRRKDAPERIALVPVLGGGVFGLGASGYF